jgi:membrane protease YdiL (CAAX protease family)
VGVLAGALATVVVALLVFVQPQRGRRRFQRLEDEVRTDPTARVRFYRGSMVAAWAMTAVVAAIGLIAAAGGHALGLPPARSDAARSAGWLLTVEMAVLLPVSAFVLRSRKPRIVRLVQRQLGHLRALLPVSREERATFVGVAITAGICEEVVFRWGGITYVRWLAPGSSDLLVIVAIGAVFGLGHLYQGRWGVLATGVAGGLFTWLTLTTGSLVPAIVIHALVDLRIVALRELPPVEGAGSDGPVPPPPR